jgi:integrase
MNPLTRANRTSDFRLQTSDLVPKPPPITRPPIIVDRGPLRFRNYPAERVIATARGPRKYKSHTLAYRLNRRRVRIVRATLKDVMREIDAAETAIANGDTALLDFNHTDRALLQRLRQLAAKCDVPLEILVSEAVEARAKNSRAKFVHKHCPEIVAELLESLAVEEAGARWIEDLESRLPVFAKKFPGPLAAVSAENLNAWLKDLRDKKNRLLGKRSRNNYRTAVVKLVKFAREHRPPYLPEDWQELTAVKPYALVKKEEALYEPEEMRAMLLTAEEFFPQHLPVLASLGFAGCRHCEFCEESRPDLPVLDWKNYHFDRHYIHVTEAVAKKNTGTRKVPLQPNLRAWLAPYQKAAGRVCVVSNLSNALARIAAKAGVAFKRNAFRNSFISYRIAVTNNVAQVAKEAGNSTGEIFESYHNPKTEAEGLAWFNIQPPPRRTVRLDDLPLFQHAGIQ